MSKTNLTVRSYDPDTDLCYVCTVTLTLEIPVWHWIKIMTHPWIIWEQIIVWKIVQIQHGSKELWSGHRILLCVHCYLYLGDRTMSQTLGSWTMVVWNIQILHGSKELWPGHEFWLFSVNLMYKTWHWVKVIAHLWVMDNNSLKYYLDPTWQ